MNALPNRADSVATTLPPPLDAADFRRLADFISTRTGIKLPPSKQALVEGRLRKRLRHLGFDTFSAYCRYLFEEGGLADEAIGIIDAVTTNKTEFFREPQHFTFLAETVLPTLLAERRRSDAPITLWSAACSSGAEPYTLAMVMEESSRQRAPLRYKVLATDLCTEVLETAAQGIYPAAAIEPVPLELRRRYLLRARDKTSDRIRIAPELRQRVTFRHLNLISPDYPIAETFDVIFCRNVLIYFTLPTQIAVVAHLCRHLAPGGYLFLGHSEAIPGLPPSLRLVGPTVFRKG